MRTNNLTAALARSIAKELEQETPDWQFIKTQLKLLNTRVDLASR